MINYGFSSFEYDHIRLAIYQGLDHYQKVGVIVMQ